MKNSTWMALFAVIFAVRLLPLRRFWLLPRKHGTDRFFSVRVDADLDGPTVARLTRDYHRAILVPLGIDAIIAALLVTLGFFEAVIAEQFAGLVITAISYYYIAAHFAVKANSLAAPATERPPTAAQLSLQPRRLRDHSQWPVEALIAAIIVTALALLGYKFSAFLGWGSPNGPDSESWMAWQFRSATFGVAVLLYLQAGLVLVKGVFVRWRLKLPARRTDDYRRWREAWLGYHLRVFDALRFSFAVCLLCMALDQTLAAEWGMEKVNWTFFALSVVAVLMYCSRERRKLAQVEQEIRPMELLKELPRSVVAEGRFLAGGLLYFNPENPGVIARSPSGIAVNLANRSTYVWAAYLSGLVLLIIWTFLR